MALVLRRMLRRENRVPMLPPVPMPARAGPATHHGFHMKVKVDDYTASALQVVIDATKVAFEHRQKHIEPESLLMALLSQEKGIAVRILEEIGVNPWLVKLGILEFIRRQPKVKPPKCHLDGLLQEARSQMTALGDKVIGEEHLLMAYANDPRFGKHVFEDLRVSDKFSSLGMCPEKSFDFLSSSLNRNQSMSFDYG